MPYNEYKMSQPNPDPKDYGLRKLTMKGKTLLISKKHSDELVILSIGASVVDTLAELGQYLNRPSEIIAKYSEMDSALLESSQAGVEALSSDNELTDQVLIDLITAGYYLITTLTQEELQEKYMNVLRHSVNGNEIIEAIEDYFAALRRSRIDYFAYLKEPREVQ